MHHKIYYPDNFQLICFQQCVKFYTHKNYTYMVIKYYLTVWSTFITQNTQRACSYLTNGYSNRLTVYVHDYIRIRSQFGLF